MSQKYEFFACFVVSSFLEDDGLEVFDMLGSMYDEISSFVNKSSLLAYFLIMRVDLHLSQT